MKSSFWALANINFCAVLSPLKSDIPQVKVALERIMRGRSVVTIAHRLSTIRNADVIVVIDGGKVVEKGSYLELAGKEGGVFSKLVKQQEAGVLLGGMAGRDKEEKPLVEDEGIGR